MVDNNGIVAYFIKCFLLILAGGSSGPPVYVIANANMPADAIDCYTIPGLGISTDIICQRDRSCFVELVVPIKPFLNGLMRPLFLLL